MTNNFYAKKHYNQTPQLSTEEWAEKKKTEKEGVYKLIDEAVAEVVSDPGRFKTFLDTLSRMERYSAANALLIYKQKPDAKQLKDYSGWAEENVRVKKGERSFSILEPVEYTREDGATGVAYNVKKVFDVSQTNGRKPPAPSVNNDPIDIVAVMLDTAPIEVESRSEMPDQNMGAFYNNDQRTLYVKKDIGDSIVLFQCVAQELAHAELALNGDTYSRRDTDFQAVCIAYMFCKKYGVDTKDFAIDRIPESWKSMESKEVRHELTKIRNAFSEIHSRVSDELYRQRQERSKDMER